MLRNYTPSERKAVREYELAFDDGENNGFGFPCDKDGNLLPGLHECALNNYRECMAHPEKYVRWNKVITLKRSYTEPAHGTCICGREVTLYDQYYGACECECGRWYNLFGQELVAPEYWQDDPSESDAYEGWYDDYAEAY